MKGKPEEQKKVEGDDKQFKLSLCRAEIEAVCRKYNMALVVTLNYKPQGIVPSLNLAEVKELDGTPAV
jgi:hypothetical protein